MNDEHARLSERERRVLRSHAAARMQPAAHYHPHRPRWKRWTVITAGWTFMVLGVLGLFLPILQGFLFLAIGLALLARELEWARRYRDRLHRRYPTIGMWSERAEAWLERQGQRIGDYFRGRA